MKTTIITLITLFSISCKAQSPIIDIIGSRMNQPNGYYVKDINNLLNPFEGTYLYTNGTTSFRMVLVKKEQQYNAEYYEDLIIGEYQYIENGVEKVNTLNEITTVYNNQRVHNIDGNSMIKKNHIYWVCNQCSQNERRLCAGIKDASTNRYADMVMRRTIEAGQQVMKVKILHVMGGSYIAGTPPPLPFSLPLGEMTLIKQ